VNSDALFQAFFEESSDALIAVRLHDSSIFRVNKTLTALLGTSREELEGERLSVLQGTAPKGFERERPLNNEVVASEGHYNDILIMTRSGEARLASVRVRHLKIDSENYALVVLSDDTERQLMLRDLVAKHQSMEMAYQELERVHSELKNTQERMAQVSKLIALGELAAGMSHELNQPLTGIRGFAQELLDILTHTKRPKRSQLKELSSDIIHNADKMAALLSHLRDFARKEKTHFQATKQELENIVLKDAIDRVLKLFKKQLVLHNTEFDISVIPEDLSVLARSHPLEQVLINLIANSRDAICEKQAQDPKHRGRIQIESFEKENHVFLRVRDNGPGIPPNVSSRIFDPFFSTKEQGKGLGLGLSISFSIVHNFGGELSLESSHSEGSSFLVKLPAPASQTISPSQQKRAA
jgi:PAS domain S-box-containing protein